MQRDDVRLAEQIVYRNTIIRDRTCRARCDKNFHAEAARDFRNPSADVAVADDAEFLLLSSTAG